MDNASLQKQSLWWRYICGIGTVFNPDVNWFNESVCGKIRDVNVIDFWKQTWISTKLLVAIFPNLFLAFDASLVNIILMGNWLGEYWSWNFSGSCDINSVQAAE